MTAIRLGMDQIGKIPKNICMKEGKGRRRKDRGRRKKE